MLDAEFRSTHSQVARPGDEMSALELCGFSELTDNVEWARYLAPQILLIFASIREYSRCNDLVAHAKREHPLFFEPDIREATGDLLLGRQITKRTIFFHDNLLGMVFLPEGIREESTEAGGRILNPVRYSRIGTHKILAAIWIVIAGLAWPSLLSLPYTAIIIGGDATSAYR